MSDKNEKVTIRLPVRYLQALDYLVELDDFGSRSEAIKAAVRDMIYQRLDLATEKVKKMEAFEDRMQDLEKLERQYLKK
jgi:Arc/MetJ-type ribon-helix-helix transcriptional regulator